MVRPSFKKGVVLCLLVVFAQGVFGASSWDQKSVGVCAQASQCLVSNSFSSSFDNIPSSYGDGLVDPAKGPKCMGSGQFIVDNYCAGGVWSSRTKLVAQRLVSLAQGLSPSSFSLYCGVPSAVLPRDEVSVEGSGFSLLGSSCSFSSFGGRKEVDNCANNVCVLKYGNAVAFGVSGNSQINGAQSVLRVFNKPITWCTNAIDSDAEYGLCGDNIWYDHATQSVIYAPGVLRIPEVTQASRDMVDGSYGKVRSYVFAQVHSAQKNFSFFENPSLRELYVAKNKEKTVVSFRERNVTLLQVDYVGLYVANVPLPDECASVFKRVDDRAQCEVQPAGGEFFLVARKSLGGSSGLVEGWQSLVGPLRVAR